MIISNNRNPSLSEFKNLVDATTSQLNAEAKSNTRYYLTRNAQLLEDDVVDVLSKTARNTKFEGTIEKVSGQRFPDIVAGRYYGIEVKSSKDEKWITLGGSVNESTRVDDVDRIFLLFGKLKTPIEFRSRPYEHCLSDVVVTHYPRYRIDMNLPRGATIFDKMNTSYDDLRLSDDPVGQIVDYYKSLLSDGESLWWTGRVSHDEQTDAAPMKIRLWKTLSVGEKRELMVTGFSLFPELLQNSGQKKYERFSLWLAANHGVLSTSTRDTFSAGGQGAIRTNSSHFEKVPRSFMHIFDNRIAIALHIMSFDESVLCETWRVNRIKSDRIGQWIDCVEEACSPININIRALLCATFYEKSSYSYVTGTERFVAEGDSDDGWMTYRRLIEPYKSGEDTE